MSKLNAFLKTMTFENQLDFAKRCNTTIWYLRKTIYCKKNLGVAICVAIERESNGMVTRQELNSNWAELWPELINKCKYSAQSWWISSC